MFDLSMSEMLVCAIVAVVVIGPKDLPKALMTVGRWVAKARGMSRNVRAGFDAMVREAEMQELEKQWAEHNEKIMREHPNADTPDAPIDPPKSDNSAPGDAAPEMAAADPRYESRAEDMAPPVDTPKPKPAKPRDPAQPGLPLDGEGERG